VIQVLEFLVIQTIKAAVLHAYLSRGWRPREELPGAKLLELVWRDNPTPPFDMGPYSHGPLD
jgi:hypothetical protein